MFGTFKLQLDVFKCPIRYYNAALHNNRKGIGLQMETVKLPKMTLMGRTIRSDMIQDNDPTLAQSQVDTSSLLHYLGISAIGGNDEESVAVRKFNGIPLLAYWDIYANYYANLQEKEGVVIGSDELIITEIFKIIWVGNSGTADITQTITNTNQAAQQIIIGKKETNEAILYINGIGLNPNEIEIQIVASQETSVIKNTLTNAAITTYVTHELNSAQNQIIIYQNENSSGQVWILSNPTSAGITMETTNPTTPNNKIELKRFDITNIDKARDNILQTPIGTEVDITDWDLIPYNYLTGIYKDPDGNFIESKSKAIMSGLGIKTYQSDRFNNWLATDYIDGANGVNAKSAIDITAAGGKLEMETLLLQQKIYNVLNRIAISGGTYRDWQEAVYGHKGTGELEIPEWMGGLSSEIVFDEVVSTAKAESAGTNEPLGSLGGRGRQDFIKKNEIHITANEPCFIMGIISITPRLDYSQGNRWFYRLDTMNDFHKPELDGIGFQDLITDELAGWNTYAGNIPGNTPIYKTAGKQLAWTEYTTNVNQAHGNFCAGKNEDYMILDRAYTGIHDTYYEIGDLTTYIDPRKYSKNFATTDLAAQHFWVQIGIGLKMNRVMQTKQIPTL
jgi:hypothetical protein